jgi:hypothetical protein
MQLMTPNTLMAASKIRKGRRRGIGPTRCTAVHGYLMRIMLGKLALTFYINTGFVCIPNIVCEFDSKLNVVTLHHKQIGFVFLTFCLLLKN